MAVAKKEKIIFCTKCSRELAPAAKFCNYCGAPQQPIEVSKAVERPAEAKVKEVPILQAGPTQNVLETFEKKANITADDLRTVQEAVAKPLAQKDKKTIEQLIKLTVGRNKYLTGFVFQNLQKVLSTEEYEKLLAAYLEPNMLLGIGTLLAGNVPLPKNVVQTMREHLDQTQAVEKEWYLTKLEKISK